MPAHAARCAAVARSHLAAQTCRRSPGVVDLVLLRAQGLPQEGRDHGADRSRPRGGPPGVPAHRRSRRTRSMPLRPEAHLTRATSRRSHAWVSAPLPGTCHPARSCAIASWPRIDAPASVGFWLDAVLMACHSWQEWILARRVVIFFLIGRADAITRHRCPVPRRVGAMDATNHRITLAQRPLGEVDDSCFASDDVPVPSPEARPGTRRSGMAVDRPHDPRLDGLRHLPPCDRNRSAHSEWRSRQGHRLQQRTHTRGCHGLRHDRLAAVCGTRRRCPDRAGGHPARSCAQRLRCHRSDRLLRPPRRRPPCCGRNRSGCRVRRVRRAR